MMDAWAKRRTAVAAEKAADIEAIARDEQAAVQAEQAEKTDEELLAEFDLPNPDELTADDNFKAFMASAVPARLRQRALRRLWGLNPVLANVDGLVEYGEDYTDAATVVENLQTAYQVGKGMLKHVEELARQAEELAEDDQSIAELDDLEEEPPEEELVEMQEPHDVAAIEPQTEEIELTPTPRPRRMQFSFEAETTA